ncbi:MAG: cyclase family protein [Coriobacteriia bacterium]|nr:cyclase family protein [Coriobacteriia bacterium]
MEVVDLTQTIEPGMSVFPGDERPTLEAVATHERDGFAQMQLKLLTHTGTHVDAPAHVLPGGRTLDQLTADQFMGTALVVDASDCGPGRTIGPDVLARHGDLLRQVDFLLVRTGWDAHWGTPRYEGGYACLDDQALELVTSLQLKGIGFDTLSPDPVDSHDLPAHRQILERGMVIIENLCNLGQCAELGRGQGGLVQFACLPLKVRDSDGSPARAIAWA